MTKAEHDLRLGTLMLRIIFADVACVRRFMQSETSNNGMYDHFVMNRFWG